MAESALSEEKRGSTMPGVQTEPGRGRSVRAQALHAFAALALALSCAPAPADTPPPALGLTVTARLLAGVRPEGADPAASAVMDDPAWVAHSKAARAGDRQLRQRLARMGQWQSRHLAQFNPGAPLLYPFSGPDFINAYALFPDAPRYVFFSLEPVGKVPQLERMESGEREALFSDLRAALNDLVALNFFITPNMKEELHTEALQGTAPILLAMMGVLGLQVDEASAFDPWPERTRSYATGAGPHPAPAAAALRIVFHDPRTGRPQTLEYYSLDVSDHALKYRPEFLPSLKAVARPTVLLKSASYLLHGEHFRRLRQELLDDAQLIVQDDTGLPYRTLLKAGYEVTLFGQYERPVKLFESRYQEDLEQAFEAGADHEPLPFPFGYNWRKEGKSGLIVARRSAQPVAAQGAPPAAR